MERPATGCANAIRRRWRAARCPVCGPPEERGAWYLRSWAAWAG